MPNVRLVASWRQYCDAQRRTRLQDYMQGGILRTASGHEPQVSCTGLEQEQQKKSPQGCDMV